jgi:hypothetical protein
MARNETSMPPDGWGEVGKVTDQATADLLQRLDEEERGDGHQPW